MAALISNGSAGHSQRWSDGGSEAMSESAYLEHVDLVAAKNTLCRNHIGLGTTRPKCRV